MCLICICVINGMSFFKWLSTLIWLSNDFYSTLSSNYRVQTNAMYWYCSHWIITHWTVTQYGQYPSNFKLAIWKIELHAPRSIKQTIMGTKVLLRCRFWIRCDIQFEIKNFVLHHFKRIAAILTKTEIQPAKICFTIFCKIGNSK